jgi:hypothetical protein
VLAAVGRQVVGPEATLSDVQARFANTFRRTQSSIGLQADGEPVLNEERPQLLGLAIGGLVRARTANGSTLPSQDASNGGFGVLTRCAYHGPTPHALTIWVQKPYYRHPRCAMSG